MNPSYHGSGWRVKPSNQTVTFAASAWPERRRANSNCFFGRGRVSEGRVVGDRWGLGTVGQPSPGAGGLDCLGA